jgi:hypothetical protein
MSTLTWGRRIGKGRPNASKKGRKGNIRPSHLSARFGKEQAAMKLIVLAAGHRIYTRMNFASWRSFK